MFDKKIIMGIVIGFCLGVSSLALTKVPLLSCSLEFGTSIGPTIFCIIEQLEIATSSNMQRNRP